MKISAFFFFVNVLLFFFTIAFALHPSLGLRRFMKSLIAISIISLLSCTSFAEYENIVLTKAIFAGEKMELRPIAGRCVLIRADQSQFPLKINGPCQFHLDLKGKLRVKMIEGTPVMLIETFEKMPGDIGCITDVQAVRMRQGRLIASRGVNHVASCPPFQWDEVVYRGMW